MYTPSPPEAGNLPLSPPGASASLLVSGRFVAATHPEIRHLSPCAFAVLMVLRQLSMGTETELDLGYRDLQEALGWVVPGATDNALDRRLGRALRELEARGLINRTRCQTRSTTAPVYRVRARSRGNKFEKLPVELVALLLSPAHGVHGAVLLRTWAAIRLLCGAQDSAVVSRNELADLLQANITRAADHRRELVALGLVFEQPRRGRASLTSTNPFPIVEAGECDLDEVSETMGDTNTAPVSRVSEGPSTPHPDLSGGPAPIRQVTPPSSVGSYRKQNPYETEEDLGTPHPHHDPSMGGRDTAAEPPSNTTTKTDTRRQRTRGPRQALGLNQDQYAAAARKFIDTCPQTARLTGKTRGQLWRWLASRLRGLTDHGLDEAIAALTIELDVAEQLAEGLRFNHRLTMEQVFTRWEQDSRVVPVSEPSPSGLPDWYERGEGLEGPSLEDLSTAEPPAGEDVEARLERFVVTLAGCLVDELETDPDREIEDALRQAHCRAKVLLDATSADAAMLVVARHHVREAWKVSWRRLHDAGDLDRAPTLSELAEIEQARAEFFALHSPQAV